MVSEQDLECLSTSDCYNSEHNSVLIVFWKELLVICWEEKRKRLLNVGAVQVIYNSNNENSLLLIFKSHLG